MFSFCADGKPIGPDRVIQPTQGAEGRPCSQKREPETERREPDTIGRGSLSAHGGEYLQLIINPLRTD